MSRINWKCVVPHSIAHAMRLTKEHGIQKNNMSVERQADHLGENSDLLYKWICNATMPVKRLIAFEQMCGRPLFTQYSAQSQGYILVPVPSGRKAQHKDLNQLQLHMAQVVSKLIDTNEGTCSAQEAIDYIKVLMQDLAYQEKNVAAVEAPQEQFNLGGEHV